MARCGSTISSPEETITVSDGLPNLVIENPILLLHARHKCVLGKWSSSTAILLISSHDLLLNSLYVGGQKSFETECDTLIFTESRAFVKLGIIQDRSTLV